MGCCVVYQVRGMCGWVKINIPWNDCGCTSEGVISVIPSILFGSSCMPSLVSMVSLNVISWHFILNFLLLNARSLSLATCIMFRRLVLCSLSSHRCISHCGYRGYQDFYLLSGPSGIPHSMGIHLKWHLPRCVLNAFRREFSYVRRIP